MSTRAVVTVIDPAQIFHVYTHHDGYPAYTARRIRAALDYAWELPRFEADEWAAAFVAAAKPVKEQHGGVTFQGGSIRLTTDWRAHGDLDYRYEVTAKDGALWVAALKRDPGELYTMVFEGELDALCNFAGVEKLPAAASRPNRFRTAVDIVDPGACNPSGIAHAVIEACREAREDGVATQRDEAVRLIVTQLAWICRANHDTDDYGALLEVCRRRAGPGGEKHQH